MHGRGRETFANGECFIVYYKNGYKLEALASRTNNALSSVSSLSSDISKTKGDHSAGFGKLKQSYLSKTERDKSSKFNSFMPNKSQEIEKIK